MYDTHTRILDNLSLTLLWYASTQLQCQCHWSKAGGSLAFRTLLKSAMPWTRKHTEWTSYPEIRFRKRSFFGIYASCKYLDTKIGTALLAHATCYTARCVAGDSAGYNKSSTESRTKRSGIRCWHSSESCPKEMPWAQERTRGARATPVKALLSVFIFQSTMLLENIFPWNMFAPTQTLLHTYNRHDHDHDHDHDHHHHRHHHHRRRHHQHQHHQHHHHHHHHIITSWSSSH